MLFIGESSNMVIYAGQHRRCMCKYGLCTQVRRVDSNLCGDIAAECSSSLNGCIIDVPLRLSSTVEVASTGIGHNASLFECAHSA